MYISYLVTVHNELEELKRLIGVLQEHKHDKDEIVILMDGTKTKEVFDYVDELDNVVMAEYPLNKDFASFKNYGNSLCTNEIIIQIDADEYPTKEFMQNIRTVLTMNQGVDVIRVPRINTVKGLTMDHVKKWNWQVNNMGWVNFPDYQMRIYKNNSEIKWVRPVHEILEGYKTVSELPPEVDWCFYHPKEIERQEKQNAFYEEIN